jgi:MFS family permease
MAEGSRRVEEGERDDVRERDEGGRDRGRDDDRLVAGRARQRDEFGGINWGAGFFGWLVSVGLAVILTAILSAAGAAIGLSSKEATKHAGTITIVGGALLLLAFVIAYFAGGYVAGRMSRFDGARQGFAAWLWGIIITLLVAALTAIAGSEYNIFQGLHLPRVPIKGEDLGTGGAIGLAAVVLGTLLAAILGGKAGQRYHKKVDRLGPETA